MIQDLKNMGLFSGLPKECNRTKNRFRSLHTVALGFASKWGHSTNTCGSSKLNSTLVITSKYLVVLDVHSPKNDTKHVSLCQVNYFCFHQYFTIFDDVSSVTMSHENLGFFFPSPAAPSRPRRQRSWLSPALSGKGL